MTNYRDLLIDDYIADNYPNAKIVNYDDKDSGLSYYTAEELHDVDEDWFPLCCYRDEKSGRLIYGGKEKIIHTYTSGETGSGKTTRYVIQSVRALSSLKTKPSFVIVDIHGEIIENLYKHLKREGYNIKILNCDDPSHSDTYNPLATLAADCLESKSITHEIADGIRRIASLIQPIESSHDPIWDRGALSYTNGLIIDKFEDLIEGNIPLESVNLYNIFQNHYWLRDAMSERNLNSVPHYREKGNGKLSVQKMIGVTNNAERTRASYFGVVENHFDVYGQPSFYMLSSSNTIDIESFINEPTVIVIQSGDSVTGDTLVSMLMNDIYNKVVKIGKANANKTLPRKIHCFLDEFANCNIADGKEFIRMLTTSRKFGMLWHLLLQCDVQLERKFDREIGKIIRANCTEIFIGTNDYETALRFADSCGKRTIESIRSRVLNDLPSLDTVNLMTTEKLNLTPTGHMYIKCNRSHLLYSYFEAFYNCPEFERLDDIIKAYPINDFDYKQTLFYPSDIIQDISDDEYRLVRFIQDVTPTPKQIKDSFPGQETTNRMRSIVLKRIVAYNASKEIYVLRAPERSMKLLDQRHSNVLSEASAEKGDGEDSPLNKNISAADISDISNISNISDMMEDEINELTDEEPEEEFDLSKDPFLEQYNKGPNANRYINALREYILSSEKDIPIEKIREFTSIPLSLGAIAVGIARGTPRIDFENDFPANENLIKYDIIEAYIGVNDFVTKTEWEIRLALECARMKRLKLFPNEILNIFDAALTELKEELDISDIYEIKKSLRGN